MLSEYNATSHENIIKRIASLHLIFEYIHPFIDGNGRIGRVLNNYLLIREGFVPINIKFIDRKNIMMHLKNLIKIKQRILWKKSSGKL